MPAAKVLAALALGAAACSAWPEGEVLRYGQALSAHKSIYSLPVALAEAYRLALLAERLTRVLLQEPLVA